MAIVSLPYQLMVPSQALWVASTSLTFSAGTLDAVGEKAAVVLRIPKTGTISKIGFRSGAVTSAGDADIRLETVTGGEPSGTLVAAGANVTVNINANAWFTATLSTPCAVTAGDEVAIVIANTTGNYNIVGPNNPMIACTYPYGTLFTTAWAKQSIRYSVALEYNDGSYGYLPTVLPLMNITTNTYGTGSTPNERGMKFRLGYSARVVGAWAFIDPDAACDLILYGADPSQMPLTGGSLSLSSASRQGTNQGLFLVHFPTPQTLLANTYYRLTLKPTTASTVTMADFDVNSAAIYTGAVEGGSDFQFTTRSGGAWTDTDQRRPLLGLMVDGIELGAGPLIGGRLVR